MYQHHIDEMTDAVMEASLGVAGDRQAVRDAIAAYWADKIALVWTLEDVLAECPGLDEDQAREVLHKLSDTDADQGVNWETINTLATAMFPDVDLDDEDDDDGSGLHDVLNI